MANENLAFSKTQNETFFKNVLSMKDEDMQKPEDIVVRNNLPVIRYSSVLVALVNVFWIWYYATGKSGKLPVGWYFASLVGMSVVAFAAFALTFPMKKDWGNTPACRILILTFVLCLVAYITAVSVSKNMELAELVREDAYDNLGVQLIAFFLLIFTFLPMPNVLDCGLIVFFVLGGCLAPAFLPGKEAYSLPQQAMLRVCILISYFVYRSITLKAASSQVKEYGMKTTLEKRSCQDELTGALNLRAFRLYGDQLVAEEKVRNLGVLMYDTDDFKQYNDYYSHVRGDETIQRITNLVAKLVEREGGYLFRYSGGKFIITIEELLESEMVLLGERVRNTIYDANFVRYDGHGSTRLTATVGCALIHGMDLETADVITLAEQQMLLGKRSGKNCTVFRDRVYGKDYNQHRVGDVGVPESPVSPSSTEKRTDILIAGASAVKRKELVDILSDSYGIVETGEGREILRIMSEAMDSLAALLLATDLPDMSYTQVLEAIREKGWNRTVPIILLAEEFSNSMHNTGISMGTADFMRRPYSPVLVRHRLRKNIQLFQLRQYLEELEHTRVEGLRSKNLELEQVNDRLIELTCEIVEARSMESGSHVRRVKAFVRALSEQLMQSFPECGLTSEKINTITYMSAMHDVGKIMVRDDVLLKPGKLTAEEFEHMKQHSVFGCEVLDMGKDIWSEDYYRVGYEIIRHHHEKYDGKGYPDGLKGEGIPLSAQIVSICDCFEALVSDRVYKKAFTLDEAYNMIVCGQCGAFSPRILSSFLRVRPKFEQIHTEMKEQGN